MKTSNSNSGHAKSKGQRPAATPEGREEQIQALAMDLAYKRLKDGTASNQLICEIIKSASTERRLKKDIMEAQKELLVAKTEAIHDQKDMKEMYSKALAAMKSYSGAMEVDDEDEEIF